MSLRIYINNEEQLTESTTVSELALALSLPERGVAMAVNNKVVTRQQWTETILGEGDHVTVIKAAFGG